MRYAHTNLVARDWRRLANFYMEVFGCVPLPPERDLEGDWLDRATGLTGAHLRGIHLRLPGHGSDGPTLEVFEYDGSRPQSEPMPDRRGFGHVAFQVDDVPATLERLLTAGGSRPGGGGRADNPRAGGVGGGYAAA